MKLICVNAIGKKSIKLICKGILFLVLFLFYLILFLLYEPYNYLGLQPMETEIDRGDVITILRTVDNNKTENIILGASKFDRLLPDLLFQNGVIDKQWTNLSMAGETNRERMSIIQYVFQKNQTHNIANELTFWGMNYPVTNRFTDENKIKIVNGGFFDYFFNSGTQKVTINRIINKSLKNRISEITPHTQLGKYIYNENINFWVEQYDAYINRVWKQYQAKFAPYTENYVDILQLIDSCKERNIELRLFTSPNQRAIFNFFKENLLAWEHDFYKEFIALYSPICDMEYEESAWTDTYGLFVDGYHFNGETILGDENPLVTDVYRTMFYGDGKEMRIITAPEHIRQLFIDNDVTINGSGNVEVYSQPVFLEKNSVYVVRCKGEIPVDNQVMYFDLYDLSGNSSGGLAGVPLRIGDSDDYLLILSDMNRTEAPRPSNAYFRIVYQGAEDLHLDSLELLQYKNDDYELTGSAIQF